MKPTERLRLEIDLAAALRHTHAALRVVAKLDSSPELHAELQQALVTLIEAREKLRSMETRDE